ETAMAWAWAVGQAKGPTLLVLTRQKLDPIGHPLDFDPKEIWRGAYVLGGYDQGDITFIATGSEVPLAVKTAELLRGEGIQAGDVLKQFPKLTADNLAMTVVDVSMPSAIGRGDYHGDAPFYPASVIKLFFMTETYHQKLEATPDMDRALREMIGVSDNDATAF